MNTTHDEVLVIALIRADLVNKKIISGLEKAGMQLDDFYLDLADRIFQLLGLPPSDELFNHYFSLLQCCVDMNVSEFKEKKHQLAVEIYEQLVEGNIIRGY